MQRAASPATLNENESAGSQAPAVDRALDILEALVGHPEGLTLTELSATLRLPKNAVFRISRALHRRGYVRRDEQTLRLSLSSKLLLLNQPAGGGRTLIDAAAPILRELRDATRETVQLGVRSENAGVVIEQLEGLHALRISVNIGLRFALHNNAPGKVLLAFAAESERDALIAEMELAPFTPRTITDRAELARECLRIVQRGFSTDYGEADEGIHCVAAPIFDRRQDLIATLWISGPSRRMPKDSFAALGVQVREAAIAVSKRLCH